MLVVASHCGCFKMSEAPFDFGSAGRTLEDSVGRLKDATPCAACILAPLSPASLMRLWLSSQRSLWCVCVLCQSAIAAAGSLYRKVGIKRAPTFLTLHLLNSNLSCFRREVNVHQPKRSGLSRRQMLGCGCCYRSLPVPHVFIMSIEQIASFFVLLMLLSLVCPERGSLRED